jgi:hypothetical protein
MLHKHKPAAGLGAGHAMARSWTIDGVLLILHDRQPKLCVVRLGQDDSPVPERRAQPQLFRSDPKG